MLGKLSKAARQSLFNMMTNNSYSLVITAPKSFTIEDINHSVINCDHLAFDTSYIDGKQTKRLPTDVKAVLMKRSDVINQGIVSEIRSKYHSVIIITDQLVVSLDIK